MNPLTKNNMQKTANVKRLAELMKAGRYKQYHLEDILETSNKTASKLVRGLPVPSIYIIYLNLLWETDITKSDERR